MLWAALGIVVLAALILVASRFSYRAVFYNANIMEQDPYVVPIGEQYEKVGDRLLASIHELDTTDFERVYITSRDGLRLAGKYYHVRDGAPLQIQFHGFRSSALRDMCGGNKLARMRGFNVLMIDQRAHGKSEGHAITFGIEERHDCLSWIRYALERFGEDTQIILVGLSMGAATVLMASDLDLPPNIKGIIADCPYSSPGAIIRKVCRDVKLPGALVYPFVAIGALVYGGFRVWDSSAVRSVKNTNIPILLLHGEDDRLVPCQMSREIYSVCNSPTTLVTFPDAGHGLCYMMDPPLYEKSIDDFIHSCGVKTA